MVGKNTTMTNNDNTSQRSIFIGLIDGAYNCTALTESQKEFVSKAVPIILSVASLYNFTLEQVVEPSRKGNLAAVRQVILYRLQNELGPPQRWISMLFKGETKAQDTSGIAYGITNPMVSNAVYVCESNLKRKSSQEVLGPKALAMVELINRSKTPHYEVKDALPNLDTLEKPKAEGGRRNSRTKLNYKTPLQGLELLKDHSFYDKINIFCEVTKTTYGKLLVRLDETKFSEEENKALKLRHQMLIGLIREYSPRGFKAEEFPYLFVPENDRIGFYSIDETDAMLKQHAYMMEVFLIDDKFTPDEKKSYQTYRDTFGAIKKKIG